MYHLCTLKILLNRIVTVEECDATDVDDSDSAGFIKIYETTCQ